MKRTTLFSIFVLTAFNLLAQHYQQPISLEQKGGGRTGQPIAFDIPAAYYSYGPKTQEIIIDGGGAVSYYDVEISSPVTNTVEISTQVNGTYDTFDISSLSPGSHVITIESPSGNIYEGTFTTY